MHIALRTSGYIPVKLSVHPRLEGRPELKLHLLGPRIRFLPKGLCCGSCIPAMQVERKPHGWNRLSLWRVLRSRRALLPRRFKRPCHVPHLPGWCCVHEDGRWPVCMFPWRQRQPRGDAEPKRCPAHLSKHLPSHGGHLQCPQPCLLLHDLLLPLSRRQVSHPLGCRSLSSTRRARQPVKTPTSRTV